MWWAGNKACDVYLGTRAFAACQGEAVLEVQVVESLHAALEAWSAWLLQAQAGASRLNIWLSGSLCRPMLLGPAEGLKTQADWQRVAAAMVPGQTGIAEPCEVWVESRAGAQGRMAAAMPSALLRELLDRAAGGGKKTRLARIAPWWAEALRVSRLGDPAPAALATRDCDSLALLMGQGSEFDAATMYAPMVDEEAVQSTLARALMSNDVPQAEVRVARLRFGAPAAPAQGADPATGALAGLTAWSELQATS